jgi:peroxiredoxin
VIVRVAVLALLLALVAVGSDAAPAAPGFKITMVDGKTTVDSRELIGKKVLVLRFQASYCKACAKESPAFGRLYDKYRTKDVEVIALHVQDTTNDTRTFIRRNKVNYPVALDPRLNIGNTFGFKGTPYTVVIDQKGEMVAQIHGQGAVARLPKILDDLLKEPPQKS